MNWHSIRDGLILTVLVLSIVCLVTSVAIMVLLIARVQSKEKEDVKPEEKHNLSQDHNVKVAT